MPFILFIFIYVGGVPAGVDIKTQEFSSQATCQAAANVIANQNTNITHVYCIKK